jgi:hypothetical protein
MNRSNVFAGLAAALGLLLLLAPASASASCADRKMTGTILGGVGGALIGNSISGGGGGALLGGLGGAVVGHEIAGSGCRSERSGDYYRSDSQAEAPRAVRYTAAIVDALMAHDPGPLSEPAWNGPSQLPHRVDSHRWLPARIRTFGLHRAAGPAGLK